MIAFQNSFRDAKLFYQGIFTYMSTYWQNTAQESELVYGLSQHLRGKQTKNTLYIQNNNRNWWLKAVTPGGFHLDFLKQFLIINNGLMSAVSVQLVSFFSLEQTWTPPSWTLVYDNTLGSFLQPKLTASPHLNQFSPSFMCWF